MKASSLRPTEGITEVIVTNASGQYTHWITTLRTTAGRVLQREDLGVWLDITPPREEVEDA